MIQDVIVSPDNKHIWDRSFFEALNGEVLPKGYRLDSFDKAHQRLFEINRRFNDPGNKGLK